MTVKGIRGMTVRRAMGEWLCEGKCENDCVKGNGRMTVVRGGGRGE